MDGHDYMDPLDKWVVLGVVVVMGGWFGFLVWVIYKYFV